MNNGIERVIDGIMKIHMKHHVPLNKLIKQYNKTYDKRYVNEKRIREDPNNSLNKRNYADLGYNLSEMSPFCFEQLYLPYTTVDVMRRYYNIRRK